MYSIPAEVESNPLLSVMDNRPLLPSSYLDYGCGTFLKTGRLYIKAMVAINRE
jgi:hypothetical protein